MARRIRCFAGGMVFCGLWCWSVPAAAQLAPVGGTFQLVPGGVRGTASAYDPRNNDFLAVGAYGTLNGRLVKPDGTFAGDSFRIDLATGFAHFPSVAYSPDADSGRGAFLVTWHSNVGTFGNLVHARLISATGALLGAETTVGSEPTWWESQPIVDYSAKSQVFMVTWRIGAYQIRAARISITGQSLDAGQGILVTTTGGEQNPSITYSPDTDNFLVSYSDFVGGVCHVFTRLVSASTGAVGAIQLVGGPAVGTYTTDVTFSTTAHQYLVAWYQYPGGPMARLVNTDGTPSGNPIPLSLRFGSYDALTLAYNSRTHSTLMVGADHASYEDGGVEIADTGLPVSLGSVLTNAGGTKGNFYPEVSASTTEGKWLLTASHDFMVAVAQFATVPVATQPPSVTTNPSVVAVPAGRLVSFSAAASGSPAPTVQWEVSADGGISWRDVQGATSTSTTLTFVARATDNHKRLRARFHNASGDAWSTATFLNVLGVGIDLDGDGIPDPVVWRPSTGTFFWLNTSSPSGTGTNSKQWGALGDVTLAGDIDGDGLADLVIWRASTGTWYWLTSSSGYSYAAQGQMQWGNQALGDVPFLADVDGDGKADLIVWRASTGTWFWLTSSSGYSYATAGQKQWGNQALGDRPFVADFDGDGFADFTVWRASTGTWFWLTSSSGYNYASQGQKQWGNASLGDVPLVGDMDGDGRSDLVVWRPATGMWFWLISSNGYNYLGQGQVQWGNGSLGDVPLLSDFDGDGKADPTIWRPLDGFWYSLMSSAGYTPAAPRQFGTAGDIPIVK